MGSGYQGADEERVLPGTGSLAPAPDPLPAIRSRFERQHTSTDGTIGQRHHGPRNVKVSHAN